MKKIMTDYKIKVLWREAVKYKVDNRRESGQRKDQSEGILASTAIKLGIMFF